MILARDLHLIIAKQIHTWLAQSVLALGDKDGPGKFKVGEEQRRGFKGPVPDKGNIGQYVNPWRFTKQTFDASHTPEIGLVPGAIPSKVIGAAEAQRMIKLVAARLKLRSGVKLSAAIGGRQGQFRHWLAGEIAGTVADSGLGQALKDAQSAELKPWSALRKNNRSRFGPQIISTSRKRSTLPIGKPFVFGGQSAHRNPPGRPALSAADWELRYRLRLMARRKTNKPGHRTGVTVPRTKHKRR